MDNIIEKAEYEMTLYGFSLKDFKRENHQFFSNQLTKSIDFIKYKFLDQIKDVKDKSTEIVINALNQAELKILESTKSNVQKIVNEEVEKLLKIPENVVLPTDRIQTRPISNKNFDELENECDELSKTVLQNAAFIKHLSMELESYLIEDLANHEDYMLAQGEKFLGMMQITPELLNYMFKP